jgi:hypothetical protein
MDACGRMRWRTTAGAEATRGGGLKGSMPVELVLDRVPHQFALVLQPHFLEQAGLMRTDGLHTQRQFARDAGRGLTLHQQFKDTELAIRQRRVRESPIRFSEMLGHT